MQAFSPVVTVHFHSPGVSQQHFAVEYTMSSQCPDGYVYTESLERCSPVLPVSSHQLDPLPATAESSG